MAKRKGKRGGKGKGAKKKNSCGVKTPAHYLKTKFETKVLHMDQIHENFKPENVAALVADPSLNDDLPGSGQNYCLHCDRHMINRDALTAHLKSKKHKQQVKKLKDAPFTQKEAEAAAGLGTYFRPPDLEVVPDFEHMRPEPKTYESVKMETAAAAQ